MSTFENNIDALLLYASETEESENVMKFLQHLKKRARESNTDTLSKSDVADFVNEALSELDKAKENNL